MKLFPPYLNRDSSGAAVVALQLILMGLFPGQQLVTGEYDAQTTVNVVALQAKLGFEGDDIDGNFGPNTRRRLKERLNIDVEGIDAEYVPGPTHFKSPEGEATWPAHPRGGAARTFGKRPGS